MDCLTGVGKKRDTTDAVSDLLGAAAAAAAAATGGNNAAGIGDANVAADAFYLGEGAGIEDEEEEEKEAEAEAKAEAEAEFTIWSRPGPVSEEAGAGAELLAEAEAKLTSAISYLRCSPWFKGSGAFYIRLFSLLVCVISPAAWRGVRWAPGVASWGAVTARTGFD